MKRSETEECKRKVLNILRIYSDTYGLKADLVNINSQTKSIETFILMKNILDEHNIKIEIDERVSVGKFMFLNRELAAANML